LGRTFVNHDVVNALLDGQYGLGMSAWQDIPAKFRTKEVLHRIVNHESKNFRGETMPGPDHTKLFTKTDWKKFNS